MRGDLLARQFAEDPQESDHSGSGVQRLGATPQSAREFSTLDQIVRWFWRTHVRSLGLETNGTGIDLLLVVRGEGNPSPGLSEAIHEAITGDLRKEPGNLCRTTVGSFPRT